MSTPGLRAVARLAALAVAAALVGACSGGAPGRLTVFAAASTTEAFEQIAAAFEARHGGVTVRLNQAGSQQLAAQLLAGAPADVFASANPAQMARVAREGLLAGEPVVFARNGMTIAVPQDNPAGVDGLADLDDDGLTVVLAAPEVPAGAYARQVLAGAGVDLQPDSLEPDVRQVVTKVALGEADAAIVYASDVRAAGPRVAEVAIPERSNVTARYPIAVLEAAPRPAAARSFVAFVRSPAGRRILRDAGFETP